MHIRTILAVLATCCVLFAAGCAGVGQVVTGASGANRAGVAGASLHTAGIGPVTVKAIPLEQHVAEKLHAYTKKYGGRPSSRVKDLVDLVLFSGYRPIAGTKLTAVFRTVFEARGTHDLPETFPAPPETWDVPYRKLAETLPITPNVIEGHALVVAFLDSVLAGTAGGRWWHPEGRAWHEHEERTVIRVLGLE